MGIFFFDIHRGDVSSMKTSLYDEDDSSNFYCQEPKND